MSALDTLNAQLTHKATVELKHKLAKIQNDLCSAVNELGTNYGSVHFEMWHDGKRIQVSSYNILNELFGAYQKALLPTFTERFVKDFLADVSEVKSRLADLEDFNPTEQ